MALRKRGVTFKICFRKRGVPRKEEVGFPQKRGVPTLKETMSSTGYQIATTKKFHIYEEGEAHLRVSV